MAQITNPEAIAFCNDFIRPYCEQLRDLQALVDAMKNKWEANSNQIAGMFGNNADTVEDGREEEGISRLTALQVSQAYGELVKLSTGGSASINTQIVQYPCVRQLLS